ncbi:MAG: malto-oligosyltrehalose trehalohydrolase, partial [Bacteroidota bacterium]|nr:malto-oligosyltrehalose trehalohydrolase [Bacteroidota bacterium]
MQQIVIDKRSVGINFLNNGKATVTVWAPLALKVEIEVKNKFEKKSQRFELTKKPYGYWEIISDKFIEGTTYKFSVDGKEPLPDPASLSQRGGVHGASEAININGFQWSDNNWENHPLEFYLIYELHTGTFTEEGTFAGIESKLEYLKELGITAIEIMPIAQFAGTRNWGYDGAYPFAVQQSYGGAKGLQQLVDSCHQKGLAVILDVVYNHLGPEGNYFGNYGPYFTDKYKTPWGAAINFDDEHCDGVRNYFIENALMWFRDFHMDALRLDAVHAIKDFSAVHILQEIKMYVNKLMQETGRTHYLIAELDLNDNRFITPINKGGYGMDAQWIDEFHHALRVTATGEQGGYYSDFKGIEHLAKAYKDGYVYDGQYSQYRKKKFGVKAGDAEGKQFIVFSQNHDQVGNRMLGERLSV